MTITEFLTARYDEDEERAASGWASLRDERWENTNEGQSVLTPRAVLADIAAKRAIVKSWRDPFGNWTAEQADAARAQKERTLILLAQPYAEHPDFDPAWSVT